MDRKGDYAADLLVETVVELQGGPIKNRQISNYRQFETFAGTYFARSSRDFAVISCDYPRTSTSLRNFCRYSLNFPGGTLLLRA